MPVRLTFSGQNPANISNIRQKGFSPKLRLSIAPGQVFSSNNPAFSSSYGKGITLATPRGTFSIPSYNFAVGAPGSEIIQSPKQATKGMRSFDRMTERYSKTPTYDRLMKGQTVMGLGGKRFDPTELAKSFGSKALNFLGKASIPLSILSPTPLGADDIVTDDMRKSLEVTPVNASVKDAMGIMNPELLDKFDRSPASSGLRETIGSRIKEGLGSIRDTVTDKLGSVGDFIKGGGIIGSALKGLGNMFEYRGGIGYVDENGVFRSADELDKLNALGGYYTDVARASRRRDASIQRMLQRKAEGKRIGEQRLKDFLEQQAKEEAARQAAARAMQDSNRANRTGGYQSSFASDTDFMEGDPNAGGRGTTATMGST